MNNWLLKLKKYTHFSPKFEEKHKPFIRAYVSNPDKVISHRFYPFIHYSIKQNGFRRPTNDLGEKEDLRVVKKKKREIFYADHLDSQIFSYYGYLINEKLEEIYKLDKNLHDSIIAYRAIYFDSNRNKCNIDFANEVFTHIKCSNKLHLTALCIDIKSFFDTLDHNILKKAWYGIFEQKNLPLDHYKVFKAITQFTYVEIGDLIQEFKEFKIKKLKYLKKKEIVSFCKSGLEFRERVKNKGLLKYNKFDFKNTKIRNYGIPQGASISATLSNLYMLGFDMEMSKKAVEVGGLYRRYSDDILFVCDNSQIENMKSFVYDYITTQLNLVVQEQKTQEVTFKRENEDEKWSCTTKENNKERSMPLSYLGFDFDGVNIRVRQKSLSLYYRNLKRLIRRKARYAFFALAHNNKSKHPKKDAWIFRHRIYKTKSHLGSKKKKIGEKVYWGNYISYINTASKVMNEPILIRQIRNHWKIIESQIKEFEEIHELEKTPSRRAKGSTI
jgi:hypothetical protein